MVGSTVSVRQQWENCCESNCADRQQCGIVVCDCDKNHTGIDDRCVSSSFCSHPVGPYSREQEQTMAPYQARLLLHLTFAQWHHSPSSSLCLTNDGSPLQQTEPHHPFKTTSSSRAILRGLQWDFCWNPQGTDQDLGFKISFKPKLVSH